MLCLPDLPARRRILRGTRGRQRRQGLRLALRQGAAPRTPRPGEALVFVSVFLSVSVSLSVSLSVSVCLSLCLPLFFCLSLILSHSLSRPSPLQSEPAVRFRLLVGLLRHGALFYDVCLCHFFMFVLMCSCLQPLGCEVCLLFWQSLPGRETRS